MRANTTDFILQLTDAANEILPTYYEEAPVTGSFPYAVIGGINIVSLSDGDLVSFNVDFYGDEKDPDAAVELERLCDMTRNGLDGLTIHVPGVLGAHIGFENQNNIVEGEHDLIHRRLSMSARIFYV